MNKEDIGDETIVYNGIEIIYDEGHENYVDEIIEYIDISPSYFFNDIKVIALMTDIKFDGKTNVDAYYMESTHTAYFLVDKLTYGTFLHELTHSIDMEGIGAPYSSSDSWHRLTRLEQSELVWAFYSRKTYNRMSESEKNSETFAMALSAYYVYPEWLSLHCPKMYEYIDNFTMRIEECDETY